MTNACAPFHPNDRFEDKRFVIEFQKGNIWRKYATKYVLAGRDNGRGYRQLQVNGKLVQSHRFIMQKWLGKELADDEYVDHIDHRRDNNAITNLRVVTLTQNNQHLRGAKSNSTSGILGVFFHRQHQKWQAHIHVAGKKEYLGYFDTKEAAAAARNRRVAELNEQGHMFTPSVITEDS